MRWANYATHHGRSGFHHGRNFRHTLQHLDSRGNRTGHAALFRHLVHGAPRGEAFEIRRHGPCRHSLFNVGDEKLMAFVYSAGGHGHPAIDAVHTFSGCFLGHHAHGCLLLDSTLDWTARQKHDRIGCGSPSIGARIRDGG